MGEVSNEETAARNLDVDPGEEDSGGHATDTEQTKRKRMPCKVEVGSRGRCRKKKKRCPGICKFTATAT